MAKSQSLLRLAFIVVLIAVVCCHMADDADLSLDEAESATAHKKLVASLRNSTAAEAVLAIAKQRYKSAKEAFALLKKSGMIGMGAHFAKKDPEVYMNEKKAKQADLEATKNVLEKLEQSSNMCDLVLGSQVP